MIIQLIVIGLAITWLLYRRHQRMTLMARHGFKGPQPNFITGNFSSFFSPTQSNIKQVTEWFEQYGDIVAFYVGSTPTLLVKDEELMKAVLIKDFQKFTDRVRYVRGGRHLSPMTTKHLITVNGLQWKETRSIVTPTFNSAKLRGMTEMMNATVDDLIKRIGVEQAKNPNGEFDIYPVYQGLTMDVICKAAFGVKTDCQQQTDKTHPFIRSIREIFDAGPDSLLAFTAFFPEYAWMTTPIRKVIQVVRDSIQSDPHNYLDHVIRDQIVNSRRHGAARKDLLQNLIEARLSNNQQITGSALTASMDTEIETEKAHNGTKHEHDSRGLTEDEIVANSFLFLVAGFETTSTALAYITHLLVNHPEIQDRVRQEAQSVLDNAGTLDYNVMSQMPYLSAVIEEGLRLYPPVTYFVNRIAAADYQFKDKTIPKGTAVMIPVPQLHRDPTQWPDPDKFDPERFLGENRSKVNWNFWMPFGGGPRNCVGMRFALMEMKLALSKVLLNYKFEIGPSTEVGEIIIKPKAFLAGPKNGVKIRAVKLAQG